VAPEIEPPAIEAMPGKTEPTFTVEPGENHVGRGIETYEAREFDKAAAYFKAAADERPDRAWTQYMLGLSLWKAGRLDEAAAEMTAAAELDADPIRAFVNLSRIQNDRGEYDAALEAARSALVFGPDDASALRARRRLRPLPRGPLAEKPRESGESAGVAGARRRDRPRKRLRPQPDRSDPARSRTSRRGGGVVRDGRRPRARGRLHP